MFEKVKRVKKQPAGHKLKTICEFFDLEVRSEDRGEEFGDNIFVSSRILPF